jgi:hypothetical protein
MVSHYYVMAQNDPVLINRASCHEARCIAFRPFSRCKDIRAISSSSSSITRSLRPWKEKRGAQIAPKAPRKRFKMRRAGQVTGKGRHRA